MTQATQQHHHFMEEALKEASRAALRKEVPVGAIIVIDNEIISRAHNEVEHDCCATKHAELLAIERASQKLRSWRLNNASLYVTLEPCPMCMGAILLSRISKLYFGAYDPRMGAAGSLYNLAEHSLTSSNLDIFPQIEAKKCLALLQDFFKEKRA